MPARLAPGHLGELTRILTQDMVDAVLSATGSTQSRVRLLPSPVVVYLLLAGALFADVGYPTVWSHLVAGLAGPADLWRCPTPGAMAQARRRVGPAPLAALFAVLSGPAATTCTDAARWRGRLVTGIDGTCLCVPDSTANTSVFTHGGGPHGGTGYPMLRLLTLVACGTRTLITAP